MKVSVSDDLRYLNIVFETEYEFSQIQNSFRKKIRDFHFKMKKMKNFKGWDGYVNFLINDSKLPIGLWKELYDVCKRYNFKLNFPDYKKIQREISYEEIYSYSNEIISHNEELKIRTEQYDAIYKAIKYRYCLFDLSQNFGKTLIIYIYSRYLIEKFENQKILIVCPDPGLVGQNYNAFIHEYTEENDEFANKIAMVHGKEKKHFLDNKKIIISNFQYLALQPPEFFAEFTAIITDEGHKISANSIKKIVNNCVKMNSNIALSGSIKKDDTADYLSLMAYSGPLVMLVSKRDLIERNEATEGKIFVVKMNYATYEERLEIYNLKDQLADGEKWLRQEQLFVRQNKKRLYLICKFILEKTRGNAVVFFTDVKYGYGKKIVQTLKEITNDKNIFYIDENVSKQARDLIKQEYSSSDEGNILVTSYATFATGVNIKNIHDVYLAEATKDFITISQALGRPMRLHKSKDCFHWWDFVDDLSIQIEDGVTGYKKTHKNYLLKWQTDRIKIYTDEGFKHTLYNIDILKNKPSQGLDF